MAESRVQKVAVVTGGARGIGRACAHALARGGHAIARVDFLLNDAGKAMPKGILEIDEAEFDRTIAVNLKSCFNYIRAIAPIMLAQGSGRIASMSSLNAYSGG